MKEASVVVERRWRGVIPAWNQAPASVWAQVGTPLAQARWAAMAGTHPLASDSWEVERLGTSLRVPGRLHLQV